MALLEAATNAPTEVKAVFSALFTAARFLLGRELVVEVASDATLETIYHGLGRQVRGYLFLDVENASGVAGTTFPNRRSDETFDATVLNLYFPKSGTYRLWVW